MSVDHLQLQISDAVYASSTWLPLELSGAGNDVQEALADFNTALLAVSGLTQEGEVVSSTDTSGTDNMQWECKNPVYGGVKYLTETNAATLRSDVITQIAAVTNLNSYKDVMVRSYRNDLQQSDAYAYGSGASDEGLEIFVTGCLFLTAAYVEPANIDTLLSSVNNAIDSISGLEFAGIVSSSTKAFADQIFIGVDDAIYNGSKYLSLVNATSLRNAVISVLQSVSDLDTSNMEVEIKIGKRDNVHSS